MSLLFFTALAVVMTFLGGRLPYARRVFSRELMSRLFSARAGILLAVAFTEILPEAWTLNEAAAGWSALGAFVLLFAIGSYAMLDSCGEYLEECRVHYLSWTALAALTVHSFIDGFNLSVSFSAGERAGIAVGLALALHKIADGFTLTSLFQQSGYSRRKGEIALFLVSAATPGAVIVSQPAFGFGGFSMTVEASLLGFAAGSFIYIAASDVLPRVHKRLDRANLLCFSLGLFGMAALKIL